jgi:hypothetical protein
MKLRTIKIVNPVARTMLQDRQPPKVVPPKKGKGTPYNRSKEKRNVLRD